MTAASLLELDAVSIGFTDPQGRVQSVLDDFSLAVAPRETVALWGPSGSGKTTLLNLVAGLLVPDRGTIRLLPREEAEPIVSSGASLAPVEVSALDQEQLLHYRRTCVGYVFQHFNLIETLTVEENIQLTCELAGLKYTHEQVLGSLKTLGLTPLANRFPAELSGGEQQRVAVLRALAHNPPLVLADEPTGNLDRDNSERVADLLWEQVNAQGASLLIATHSETVAKRADRVIEFGQLQ